MNQRRSTQIALTAATLCIAAVTLAAPLSHVAAAPVVRPQAVGTVSDGIPGAPIVRSIRIAVVPSRAVARVAARAVGARRSAVSPLVLPAIPTGRDSVTIPALQAVAAFAAFTRHPSISNFARYVHLRSAVAAVAARRLGLDQGAMQAAWNKADTAHQIAVLSAFTQLGVPYHRISRRPGVGFDCSGLTSWAWDQAGIALSHVANAQIRAIKNVDRASAEAGDIVYFPGHAMMYLGISTAIIHSPYTGRSVEIDVLKYHDYSTRYGDPLPGL